MKHCVVADSGFIVATIDAADSFHTDALFVFSKLLRKKDKVRIIIPPLALYEVIVVLHRKGFTRRKVKSVINKLLDIQGVIVLSITETAAFKHCQKLLTQTNQSTALRTADFMIACVGLDFEAQILTFDKTIWTRVKPLYPKVYYCSALGKMTDETGDFLTELDSQTV